MNIFDISEDDLPAVKAFLERWPETSLFLLSNIRAFGHRLGTGLYSGNFKGIREDNQLVAVFCLARSGGLLVQAGGRQDVARPIVDAARQEGLPIRGVLGEWHAASAVWTLFCADGVVVETMASKEVLYRLGLSGPLPVLDCGITVRRLTPEDHDAWEPLSVAFQEEINVPLPGDRDQRKASFCRSADRGHWWGGFDGTRLVSIGAIIALHKPLAQIGAVFTVPERRRRGFTRAVMKTIVRDARLVHDLERLFLFTGENNTAARRLYEALGFESFGHFGLFFGQPRQG